MAKEKYGFHMPRKTMKKMLAYKEQVAEGFRTRALSIDPINTRCLGEIIGKICCDQVNCVVEEGRVNKREQLKLLAEFIVGMTPEEFFHCFKAAEVVAKARAGDIFSDCCAQGEPEELISSLRKKEQGIFKGIQEVQAMPTQQASSTYLQRGVYVDNMPLNQAAESRWGIGIWAGLSVASILPGFVLIVLGIFFTATGFGATLGVPLVCGGSVLCGMGALSGVKIFDVAGVTIDAYKPKYFCLESLPKDDLFAQKHPRTYIFTLNEMFYSDGKTVKKISIENNIDVLRKSLRIITKTMDEPKVLSANQLRSIASISGHDYRRYNDEEPEQKVKGSVVGIVASLGGAESQAHERQPAASGQSPAQLAAESPAEQQSAPPNP